MTMLSAFLRTAASAAASTTSGAAAAAAPGAANGVANARQTIQKLFVANVPWTVGNRELKLYFSKFGHVASASVVYDKQCGMSRGFGFVQYSNRQGYNAAVNQTVHSLEGRALSVQTASSS